MRGPKYPEPSPSRVPLLRPRGAPPKFFFEKSQKIDRPRGRRPMVEHLNWHGLPGRAVTAVLPQWPLCGLHS
jgi:hypothetical protein